MLRLADVWSLICASVLVVFLTSCHDTIEVPLESQLDVATAPGPVVIEGEPGVQMGYVFDEEFDDIEDIREFRVAWGTQGGYWSMPHIRVTGIGDPQKSGGATMYMACLLISEAGETLTDINVKARLYAGDGYLVAPNYPLPVIREDPDLYDQIPELDGVKAQLDCTVSDNSERSAALDISLTLAVTP